MANQTKEFQCDFELAPGSKAGPPLKHTISAEKLTTTYKLPFKFNEKNGMMKVYKNGKWKRCCQYCPKTPHHPDENENPWSLCATHAREVGSHKVRNPCRDCPPGKKVRAHYPDENGNPRRLCATHATDVGSHEVLCPCRDCPPGKKPEAHYPDENGKPNSLCARHAVLAGTHVESMSGASVIACKCFDRWERLTGERIGHRVRYVACVGGSRTEGREIRGLIPGRRIQPDGYQEETKTVWLFHGNYFHGFPPDHPKHETYLNNGKWGPDLYKDTMEQMALYVKHGYTVRYVWEHEYIETTRATCPVSLREVVHNACF
jgi:hypothetical protein